MSCRVHEVDAILEGGTGLARELLTRKTVQTDSRFRCFHSKTPMGCRGYPYHGFPTEMVLRKRLGEFFAARLHVRHNIRDDRTHSAECRFGRR